MSDQRPFIEAQLPMNLTCTDEPSADDIRAVEAGLKAYNRSVSSLSEVRPLNFVLHDNNKQVSAGLLGRTWGKCCEILVVWVRNDLRSHGVGERLMLEAEEEARARGCDTIYLSTFSFQAPDFYRNRGYEEVHQVRGYGHDVEKIFFVKSLGATK